METSGQVQACRWLLVAVLHILAGVGLCYGTWVLYFGAQITCDTTATAAQMQVEHNQQTLIGAAPIEARAALLASAIS